MERMTTKKQEPDKRKCELCGGMFTPKDAQADYCSDKCWDAHIEELKGHGGKA